MRCLVVDRVILPVTCTFDFDGDETSDPYDVYGAVVLMPDGRLVATRCCFDDIKDHKTN